MAHRLELNQDTASVREARLFVTQWARAWGYHALVPMAALLTSEIASNAVMHAKSRFVVDVTQTREGMKVAVFDHSVEPPRIRDVNEVNETGRGLRIVDSLAAAWGSDEQPPEGKWVWFELSPENWHYPS